MNTLLPISPGATLPMVKKPRSSLARHTRDSSESKLSRLPQGIRRHLDGYVDSKASSLERKGKLKGKLKKYDKAAQWVTQSSLRLNLWRNGSPIAEDVVVSSYEVSWLVKEKERSKIKEKKKRSKPHDMKKKKVQDLSDSSSSSSSSFEFSSSDDDRERKNESQNLQSEEVSLNEEEELPITNTTTQRWAGLVEDSRKHIEICMGPKCKRLGAESLFERFQKIDLDGDLIHGKCTGNCKDGPNLRILTNR